MCRLKCVKHIKTLEMVVTYELNVFEQRTELKKKKKYDKSTDRRSGSVGFFVCQITPLFWTRDMVWIDCSVCHRIWWGGYKWLSKFFQSILSQWRQLHLSFFLFLALFLLIHHMHCWFLQMLQTCFPICGRAHLFVYTHISLGMEKYFLFYVMKWMAGKIKGNTIWWHKHNEVDISSSQNKTTKNILKYQVLWSQFQKHFQTENNIYIYETDEERKQKKNENINK